MKTALVPSIVGVGSTDAGLLSDDILTAGRSQEQPYTVTWDDLTYLTGPNVHLYARPSERLDFRRLSEGPELVALTYTTLGVLLGSGEHTLSLMIGLPVEVMADRAQALAILRAWQTWLVGEHAFKVNTRRVRLIVEGVQITSQPAGAYAAWAFNDRGQVVLSKDDQRATVAVCDIGFNTLDLLTMRAGQPVLNLTGGDTAGIRRAAETLRQTLARAYRVNLTRHEADALLRMARPEVETRLGFQDVRAEVTQALGVAASGVVSFVNERWADAGNISRVLFTGGGAEALRDELLKAYPHGRVLPHAVTANALGLARMARRAFADAPVVAGLDPGFGGFKAVLL